MMQTEKRFFFSLIPLVVTLIMIYGPSSIVPQEGCQRSLIRLGCPVHRRSSKCVHTYVICWVSRNCRPHVDKVVHSITVVPFVICDLKLLTTLLLWFWWCCIYHSLKSKTSAEDYRLVILAAAVWAHTMADAMCIEEQGEAEITSFKNWVPNWMARDLHKRRNERKMLKISGVLSLPFSCTIG